MKRRAKTVIKNCIINEMKYSEHPSAVDSIYWYYKRSVVLAIVITAIVVQIINVALLYY